MSIPDSPFQFPGSFRIRLHCDWLWSCLEFSPPASIWSLLEGSPAGIPNVSPSCWRSGLHRVLNRCGVLGITCWTPAAGWLRPRNRRAIGGTAALHVDNPGDIGKYRCHVSYIVVEICWDMLRWISSELDSCNRTSKAQTWEIEIVAVERKWHVLCSCYDWKEQDNTRQKQLILTPVLVPGNTVEVHNHDVINLAFKRPMGLMGQIT